MGFPQENSPTFVLRRICDKIQAKTSDLLNSFKPTQVQKHNSASYKNGPDNEQTRIYAKTLSAQLNNFRPQQSFIEAIKNDLCRIISSELPQVVNYQTKVNDRIEDLEQEIEECKKVLKIQKQNYKESILERDNLKLEILQFQHQNKQLTEEIDSLGEKYNQSIGLVGKYMKEIQRLQAQNISLRQKKQQQTNNYAQYQQGLSNNTLSINIASPKYGQTRQINFPLQIKEKLNEAQKLLNRSPRSRDLQLESSHFQLSTQIVGCQKELLQIQLKNSQKEKAQISIELQEERNYVHTLQKEVDNLEKLLDGEKKLNQKLDRELYTLINATKQMKIQLLEQKAKNKQLQEQVFELEQATSQHHKQTTQMQQRITELQIQQKKATKLQDQLQQLKAKLQISEKKYEQLRRIKHQLQQKAQLFQQKLNQIQHKEIQDQLKQQTFHQTIKSQNISKIKHIQEMSFTIKQKYQQKIEVMDKHYKELKEKYKFLKQQNIRLYEGFEIQSKKEIKMEEKYEKTLQRKEQLEQQFVTLKKDNQLLEEKWKTQYLLSKELKRELLNAQKSKQLMQRKIKKLHISKLPNLLAQIKLIKEQAHTMKSTITTYNEIITQISSKYLTQYSHKLNLILSQEQEKFTTLQTDYSKKVTLLQHWKKQFETSQNQKIKLIERINCCQSKQSALNQQVQRSHSELEKLTQKLSSLQSTNLNTQKQLQKYKKIQKNGMEQIQVLREKQNQVENFYNLVDQLTSQNQQLKAKLQKTLAQHQQFMSFNHSHYHSNNTMIKNNQSLPSYLIPQRQSKPKISSKSGQSIANSHSCVHLRPSSKSKPSINIMDIPKNPSLQNRSNNLQAQHFYDQTVPNQLPIHSRPIMFNSRKSQVCMQPCQTLASQEIDFRQLPQTKYHFQTQKQRLQEIKNEYQKMMVDKFRQDFVQKRSIDKRTY